jgi:hypothetical protein
VQRKETWLCDVAATRLTVNDIACSPLAWPLAGKLYGMAHGIPAFQFAPLPVSLKSYMFKMHCKSVALPSARSYLAPSLATRALMTATCCPTSSIAEPFVSRRLAQLASLQPFDYLVVDGNDGSEEMVVVGAG